MHEHTPVYGTAIHREVFVSFNSASNIIPLLRPCSEVIPGIPIFTYKPYEAFK